MQEEPRPEPGSTLPPPRPGGEKEAEKTQEKTKEKGQEKGGFYGEKWVRDTLSTITWGLIIIWAGVVFLISSLSGEDGAFFMARFEDTWSWILLGAGVLLLLESLVRLVMPEYRRPLGGRVFLGAVLLAIGLAGVIELDITVPVILIAVGLVVLFQAFRGRRGPQ